MTEKAAIELTDIVAGDEFLPQICAAARLSQQHKAESGFIVHCDEKFGNVVINQAVLGEEYSIKTDMTEGVKCEPQTGVYVQPNGYRLVHVHFHPPETCLFPSESDIKESALARVAGMSLRDDDFSIHAREARTKYGERGVNMDYPNPVSIIGLVRRRIVELLVYQWITREPIPVSKFWEFAGTYSRPKVSAEDIEMFGFSFININNSSPQRAVEFLAASTYLRAVYVRMKNGYLSDKDLEKLKPFHLIKTIFIPD